MLIAAEVNNDSMGLGAARSSSSRDVQVVASIDGGEVGDSPDENVADNVT